MQEGRRYKVIKIEKTEKQKEDIAVGITNMAIGVLAIIGIYYGGYSGIVDNNEIVRFVATCGAIELGRGIGDIAHGLMSKTYVNVPDEVIERYDNEKGRGAK